MYRRLVVPVLAFVLLISAACKKAEQTASTTPAAEPTAAAPASTMPAGAPVAAAPAAAPAVLGTTEYRDNGNLRADLTEVRRVSGGALLVKWRVTNATPPAEQAGLAAASKVEPIHYDFSWDDLYYVDPAENKKYEYLKDSEGNRILDVWYGSIKTGETKTSWAKFPAPPPTSTKISITLPRFAPIEDVPIAQ